MSHKLNICLTLSIISLFYLVPEKSLADNSNNPPSGIKLDDIFKTPDGSNSSVINQGSLDIVDVTPSMKNQSGAVWNTDNNMMDLTKNFESSMHLYFGDKGKNAADGMAFIMHADPNGNNAFRTGVGARIGVWDSTRKGDYGMAIDHSIAVEFDTHHNDAFDDEVKKGNHIAWNYPGKKDTYFDSLIGGREMVHKDVQYPENSYLSDDQWHNFNITWNATTSTLTYQFDSLDKISIPIDVNNIFGTNQVYWGFTGSTGGDYANNRIVFDSVPGLVEGTVSEKIVNKSTGLPVNNTQVSSGTTLTHTIDTEYLSGKQVWRQINVIKSLNNYVEYVPGSLRLVDMGGHDTSIPDSSWVGNNLNLQIGDLESTLSNYIKRLIFDVKVKPVSSNTNVNESVISAGKNYISRSGDTSYTIISNQAPIVTLENANQEININDVTDVDVKGNWLDTDSESASLYYQLNEDTPILFEQDSLNDPKNTNHNYSTTILSSGLKVGTNSLKVWAVDKEGAQSNIETRTINVKGTLKFENIPNFDFGTFSIPLKNEMIYPLTKERIKLSDTRGSGSTWALNVKLKKLFTSLEGNRIDDFYYVNQNNQQQSLQVDELVGVSNGVTQDSPIQEIPWSPTQGLAVELLPSNYVGEYSSELEWVLEDTPTS